ncbi:MAG TPA: hypothetical protein DCE41_36565 [Cytophagales bacterium]|nr:hypothetical protein [Cytophagales bacterium]HAA18367.1 hypothetical protein [Cytophagales bacterium]HAP60351.1 hypothetical protein [Cytophagales bacterium]
MNLVPFFHQLAIWCTLLTAVVVSGFTYVVVNEEGWRAQDGTLDVVATCGTGVYYYSEKALEESDPQYLLYQEGEGLFYANCYACHRIHADWTGPSLAGVTERRSKLWLYDFIWDNNRLVKRGDQQAIELIEAWNGSVMTRFEWMTTDQLEAILKYIEVETEDGPTVVASQKNAGCY